MAEGSAGVAGCDHAGHPVADRERPQQPHGLDPERGGAVANPGPLPAHRHLDPGGRGVRAPLLRAVGQGLCAQFS